MSRLWNPLVVEVELRSAQVGKKSGLWSVHHVQTVKSFQAAKNRPVSILGKTRSWFIQGADALELVWNGYFSKNDLQWDEREASYGTTFPKVLYAKALQLRAQV